MKKILDIAEQSPSEIFLEHSMNFGCFKEELLSIYSDYPNKHKIVTLLDYWIFNIFSLKKIYGERGLISFCDSDLVNPLRFSFLYEFSNQIVGSQIHREKSTSITFFILKFFLKRVYIPGATLNWFGAKILNRLSYIYVKSIPARKNLQLKEKIFQIIDEMLLENYSDAQRDKIKAKLPEIFYSNMVELPFQAEVLVEGSSASFLEFSGIEKLFLLNNNLRVTGFQHGGGYDIFQIDYFVDYEKKLSDKFYGWGFSRYNKQQNKFKKLKKSKNIQSNEKRILWIEDSSVPTNYFALMPYHHYQSINVETKSYIYQELDENNVAYSSLYHPSSRSPLYQSFRRDDYSLSGKGLSENLVCPNDILIFDNSGATLIHFAIESNLVFFLIISRDDYDRFTVKQREFFMMLKKYHLGFYSDEHGLLIDSVLKITGAKNYFIPLEIVYYYNEVFKVSSDTK
jgi:hypothetical protein